MKYSKNIIKSAFSLECSYSEEMLKGLCQSITAHAIVLAEKDIIPINKRNDEGRGLVVFNSSGFIEIAMYKSNKATIGGASKLMGLKMMDSVTIQFYDN